MTSDLTLLIPSTSPDCVLWRRNRTCAALHGAEAEGMEVLADLIGFGRGAIIDRAWRAWRRRSA